MGLKNSKPREENKNVSLIQAVYHNNLDTVKRLVDHGANVNSFNSNNITLLMFARGNVEIVDFLLKRGIRIDNIFKKNNRGENILDIAKKTNNQELLLLLQTFVKSQIEYMECYLQVCKKFQKRTDDSKILTFYISTHRKFVRDNLYKNLSFLIKNAPTFGHSFTVYTSDKFTIIDKDTIASLKKGESVEYPRLLKCALYKPVTSDILLVITISDEFLFSKDGIVFISPRFLNVKAVVKKDNFTTAYIQ
jgi:FOG: Ankyrin repeat